MQRRIIAEEIRLRCEIVWKLNSLALIMNMNNTSFSFECQVVYYHNFVVETSVLPDLQCDGLVHKTHGEIIL